MKKIYKYYKDRLIEISGKNRSLYSKKVSNTNAFDLGRLFETDSDYFKSLVDFLWKGDKVNFEIVSNKRKEAIIENLNKAKRLEAEDKAKKKKKSTEPAKEVTVRPIDEKTVVSSQVKKLRLLKRALEDFEKETGRYELFLGYPFVSGSVDKDTVVKAPLLLFPIVLSVDANDTTASVELKPGEMIQLNKVFITAYARQNKVNIENLNLEFESMDCFKSVSDVLKYLDAAGIKISPLQEKLTSFINFDRIVEPEFHHPLSIYPACVLGKYPLANSIYNDYLVLEKKGLYTDAIKVLIENKSPSKAFYKRQKYEDTNIYSISPLDFAQESAIEKLQKTGNLVIYGPPGTGKSQTIVNVISDAIVKNKRVLVVSQKKAALDVVFNRLGTLNKKAMFIVDPEKSKGAFYESVKSSHLSMMEGTVANEAAYQRAYNDVTKTLENEVVHLETISKVLFSPTDFGISLQEAYASSYMISKTDGEYELFEKIIGNSQIMRLNYPEMQSALRIIEEKNRTELYYQKLEMQKANPFVAHLAVGLDVHTLNEAAAFFESRLSKRAVPFDFTKYPNMRQALGFYLENELTTERELKPIIKFIAKLQRPKLDPKDLYLSLLEMIEAVKAYVGEYYLLSRLLDKKGFAMAVDGVLTSNSSIIKNLLAAINQYSQIRDINITLGECSENQKILLNFAYENSQNLTEFKKVASSILPIRTYHEVVLLEEKLTSELSKIMDFPNIQNRIVSLKAEQQKAVKDICVNSFSNRYRELYNSSQENNNFFHQISKNQNLWPIRKLVEFYSELLFTLYPCWLLSPESVSQLLPLVPNLFDLILFDEASQVFIENTLPTIYRGKHIAVAGDAKQLRPTANFIRRYMGGDDIDENDLNTQAALEVESLLDLATSRFKAAHLNYHYRSKFEELISFSNTVFYDSRLEISPNLEKNLKNRPIERIKVDGKWINRCNEAEAEQVVSLLKKILKERKNNETIGIITFNAEQGAYITDLIDKECAGDNSFRSMVTKERLRIEQGEDRSLFIKNLENVQGDERDIIIFSIGYAQNENGKVVSHFGPLNIEGGENRLNVAVTRAKEKVIVVTSIEPEQLNVEHTKNQGPKIFKKYLEYVRAVASSSDDEAYAIISSLRGVSLQSRISEVEENCTTIELKAALEKLGYTVEQHVGTSNSRLDLAIYDKASDRYILGIEFDFSTVKSSPSILERDVYRTKFLKSRGWSIYRVWSRDFWLNKQKTIATIDKLAKDALGELKKTKKKK